MYHTTGLHASGILDVCERIHREAPESEHKWPPILGLYKSVVVTLAYLRRNRTQAELAETYETKAQFRKFTDTLTAGCGPDCGTATAEGAGCQSCGVGCAIAGACGTRKV